MDRPAAPRKTGNATGDDIITDGKITVVMLAGPVAQSSDTTLKPRPAPKPQ